MDIDTYENEMICQTVDDATLSAARSGQASQLAICVIEKIRPDMKIMKKPSVKNDAKMVANENTLWQKRIRSTILRVLQ